ncbi:MAG: Lrp/AsnC family transcriptional regulator [Actinobacteria bacterium]|nr:Lrp/AsnC family transcriptional regulator [Actinomycetota bacterium]
MSIALDPIDWKLLAELQIDARLSFSELSRRVHLSAPAVGERVRRLEQAGVITGYHAGIDLTETGWSVLAMVRIACYGSTCVLRDPAVATWPGVLEIHRVTGADCSLLKVVATSMQGFEHLIDKLATYGTPSSTLILSSPLIRSDVVAPQN